MNDLKTVVLITFMIKGISIPIHITSKNEPNKLQIIETIKDITEHFEISGAIIEDGFNQKKGMKIYKFIIGDKNCVVSVERLDLIEFPK